MYRGQDLHIAFPFGNEWYLYNHDELFEKVLKATTIGNTMSWNNRGGYSFSGLREDLRQLLEPYRVKESKRTALEDAES